jgi:lipopolysaccharide transport system ATP-binding protein
LTIRLNYRCDSPVDAADVTLSVHHESGAVIAQPRSNAHGRSLAFVAGDGHVDFTVDELLLAPGMYLLSTAITYQGHAFDWRDRRYELPVHSSGVDVGGLVRFPGRWRLEQ